MDKYHLYEQLAKGKFSEVFKGRRKQSIDYYAIKGVQKSRKARVLQEVRLFQSCLPEHDRILRLHEWQETTNHIWMVLEYCVGGSLMDLIRHDIRLPEDSIHALGYDILEGLHHLHRNGIVHGDLKPSNLLLDDHGRLKICSLSLARRLTDISRTPVRELPKNRRGTPAYMAPELFENEGVQSFQSDMWAYGCILYECSSGHPPYIAPSLTKLVDEITNKTIERPNVEISTEFNSLLSELLEKDSYLRLCWPDVTTHRFWQYSFEEQVTSMPVQEAFNLYHSRTRATKGNNGPLEENIDPQTSERPPSYHATQGGALERHAHTMKKRDVDILRLSRAARINIEADEEFSGTYRAKGKSCTSEENAEGVQSTVPSGNDILLNDMDAELDFSERDVRNGQRCSDDDLECRSGPEGEDRNSPTSSSVPLNIPEDGRDSAQEEEDEQIEDDDQDISFENEASESQELRGSILWIEEHIWHASDSSVRPIAQNRRIEKQAGTPFNPRQLPFDAVPLADMLAMSQTEMEQFLTDIYQSIAGNSSMNEKVNALMYFETLCADVVSANLFVNSNLMSMLVNLMKASKAAVLRSRVASVLGILIRHATYISDDMMDTRILQVLSDGMKDSSERVRRRSAAAFGELLFYIATQQQEVSAKEAAVDATVTAWSVPPSSLTSLCSLIRSGEDEIAMHYATKTIENIATLGGHWGQRFATIDLAQSLLLVYQGMVGNREDRATVTESAAAQKGEQLRGTIASTLARLCRARPKLVIEILDRGGSRTLLGGLRDGSSRVQQAFISIIIMVLLEDGRNDFVHPSFVGEERFLANSLDGLINSASPVIRGKSLICCSLLASQTPRWLIRLSEIKFLQMVERHSQPVHNAEKDSYSQQTASVAQKVVIQIVPRLLANLQEDAERCASGSSSNYSPARNRKTIAAIERKCFMSVLVDLVMSSRILRIIFNRPFLMSIGGMLQIVAASPSTPESYLARSQISLLQVVEAVFQKREILSNHAGDFVSCLIPPLLTMACQNGISTNPNTVEWEVELRTLSMKLLSDILMSIVNDPTLYRHDGSGTETRASGDKNCTSTVDRILRDDVLPSMSHLLDDTEPLPVYALKLLSVSLDARRELSESAISMGLLSRLVSFLSLDHPNNNVHNAWACSILISAPSVTRQELLRLRAPSKVIAVVAYAYENGVEPFLEPSLRALLGLIGKAGKSYSGSEIGSEFFVKDMLKLVEKYCHVLMRLMETVDGCTSELASQCLEMALNLGNHSPQSLAVSICGKANCASLASVLTVHSENRNEKEVALALTVFLTATGILGKRNFDKSLLASRKDLSSLKHAIMVVNVSTDAGEDLKSKCTAAVGGLKHLLRT